MSEVVEIVVPGPAAAVEVAMPALASSVEVAVPGPQGPAGLDYTGPKITVSATAPADPDFGDIWIDIS